MRVIQKRAEWENQFRRVGIFNENDEMIVKKIKKNEPLPKRGIELDDLGSEGTKQVTYEVTKDNLGSSEFIENLEKVNQLRVEK